MFGGVKGFPNTARSYNVTRFAFCKIRYLPKHPYESDKHLRKFLLIFAECGQGKYTLHHYSLQPQCIIF